MNDPELVMGEKGAGANGMNGAPANINDLSTKASPSDKTMPDGEKKADSQDANAHPGDSTSDPQNLAKDAQAGAGTVGTQPDAKGTSSLGAQVGTSVASDDRAGQERVIEDQPEQRDAVRTSWAEQGHTNQ